MFPSTRERLNLPGGGRLVQRYSASNVVVIDQHCTSGRTFRWLCSKPGSRSEQLTCESVVEIVATAQPRLSTRGARALRWNFAREELLPQYHRAMIAAFGLSLRPAKHCLFLGVGGATLPLYFAQHYPRCINTLVESEAAVVDIAVRFFGCIRGPRCRLHRSTAAAFLRRFPRGRYDAIFVDVTSYDDPPGSVSAPSPSLRSRAALHDLRKRLRPGGVLILNVLGSDMHVRDVGAAMVRAFAGQGQAQDVVRLLRTTEGNAVLVGVVGGASRAGASSESMYHHSEHETEGAEPVGWLQACASLDLGVERCA